MKKILTINILTFLILGILSCSGNQQAKTSQSTKNNEKTTVSPLNEIFKKTLKKGTTLVDKITLYDLLRSNKKI